MFPLGTVLFPHQPMPLHAFEDRYRSMVRDCLASVDEGTAPAFGVVLIERGSEVGGGDTRFDVGTLAHITDLRRFDDGRYGLLVRGATRLRVMEWLPDDPYPRADVTLLEDATPGDAEHARELVRSTETLLREVHELRRRVLGTTPTEIPDLEALSEDRPADASYLLALLAELGPLDAQTLLGCPGVDERLERLARYLAEERDALAAQSDS